MVGVGSSFGSAQQNGEMGVFFFWEGGRENRELNTPREGLREAILWK